MKTIHQLTYILLLFFSFTEGALAEPSQLNAIELSLKPKECVVFKQGDKCYASVVIRWQAAASGDFCLYRTPGTIKLECWSNLYEGRFTERLETNEPVDYYLVKAGTSVILISKKLRLSWVYDRSTRPERTWRIF